MWATKELDNSTEDVNTHFAFVGDPIHFRIISRKMGTDKDLKYWYFYQKISSRMRFADGDPCYQWALIKAASYAATEAPFSMIFMGEGVHTNNRYVDSDNPLVIFREYKGGNDLQAQKVYSFTYHVTTPLTSTDLTSTISLTDASALTSTYASLPAALKRKFVTKYKLYYLDSDGVTKIFLSQTDVQKTDGTSSTTLQYLDNVGVQEIYVDYEFTLPFNTCTSYSDADTRRRWYSMKVDNRWAFDDRKNSASYKDIHLQTSPGTQGIEDYDLFAFIGDPYELRIICRYSGGDYYLGVTSGASSGTDVYYSEAINNAGINTWEIIDAVSSNGGSITSTQFGLRQLGTYDSPWYLISNYSAGKVQYSSSEWHSGSHKIEVIDLPATNTLTYSVIDNATGIEMANATSLYIEGSTATIAFPEKLRRGFCSYTLYTSYLAGTFSGTPEASYTMNAYS